MDRGHVLVIEDDNDVALILDELLRDNGYSVTRAANGDLAMREVDEKDPDLILLDLVLPDISGFELCRQIRESHPATHTPILMLTGRTGSEDRVRGLRCGADDYVTKPFDSQELLARVWVRLEQNHRERGQREAAVRAGLQAIGHLVATPETTDDIVARVLDVTRTVLGVDACGILLWNQQERFFEPAGSIGLEPSQARIFAALQTRHGVSAFIDKMFEDHQPFTIDPKSHTSLSQSVLDIFQKERLLVAPMRHQNALFGMLIAGRDAPAREFIESDIELISGLANQAAMALANRRALEELKRLAQTDPLTGLFNAGQFGLLLDQHLERSRSTGDPTSLIMLDLDHLKSINDTHGHPAGTAVLAAVGRTLRGCIRGSDVAARYGGDEFAAILSGADHQRAQSVAERILGAIQGLRVDAGGKSIAPTVSIGLATSGAGRLDQDALLRAADGALYDAKQAGRNCVRSA